MNNCHNGFASEVSARTLNEAEPLYKRALAIWEQQLGKNHPDVASSLNNLALLYQPQGRYTEAELLHQRSLAIWELHLGANHPQVAIGLNALALLYYYQGRYHHCHVLQRPPPPHFHVRYGQQKAIIEIQSPAILEGKLSPRVLGLVIDWAASHQAV